MELTVTFSTRTDSWSRPPIVRTHRNKSTEMILQCKDEAIVNWQGDQPQQDDITAIVIKRTTEKEYDDANAPNESTGLNRPESQP